MIAHLAVPLTGLVFGMIAARFYSPEDVGVASAVIAAMTNSNGGMYAAAAVYGDVRKMIAQAGPHAVFIGVPPNAHAGTEPPTDLELACAAAGVHMFIEKPLGSAPPEELAPVARALADAADRKGLIVSVGYMFRYHKAVEAMQRILAEAAGPPRAILARYACAYSEIRKTEWWDLRCSGGPIVEQGTHEDLLALKGHYWTLVRDQLSESDRVRLSFDASAPGS